MNLQSEISKLESFMEDDLAYIQFLGAAGTVTGSKHLINTSSDPAEKSDFRC